MDLLSLRELANDDAPSHRFQAAGALGACPDPEAVLILRQLAFHDPDSGVRTEARRQLVRLRFTLQFSQDDTIPPPPDRQAAGKTCGSTTS